MCHCRFHNLHCGSPPTRNQNTGQPRHVLDLEAFELPDLPLTCNEWMSNLAADDEVAIASVTRVVLRPYGFPVRIAVERCYIFNELAIN